MIFWAEIVLKEFSEILCLQMLEWDGRASFRQQMQLYKVL